MAYAAPLRPPARAHAASPYRKPTTSTRGGRLALVGGGGARGAGAAAAARAGATAN
jgi:hypothetical protein